MDVKRKLARLISVSTLIQEKLLKKEIINGICHMLEQKDEIEMLSHTVLACSNITMNYEFCSSPLSYQVLSKLIPLIPIFKGKDLYVLLITVSKIMQGRDDNNLLFSQQDPGFTKYLLESAIENSEQKDLSLAVSLVLKELFTHDPNNQKIREDKETFKLVEVFLVLLSKSNQEFQKYEHLLFTKKTGNTPVAEFKGRSDILGFEVDLIFKDYAPINEDLSKSKL